MCMRATCGQYTRDLKSRADLDTFIFRIHRFRVVVVNIDILNTSRRAPKSSQDRLRWWREWARRAAETAEHKQERLTKCRERDRAGALYPDCRCMNPYNLWFSLFCIYIHCKHAVYFESLFCCLCNTNHTTRSRSPHNAMHSPSSTWKIFQLTGLWSLKKSVVHTWHRLSANKSLRSVFILGSFYSANCSFFRIPCYA